MNINFSIVYKFADSTAGSKVLVGILLSRYGILSKGKINESPETLYFLVYSSYLDPCVTRNKLAMKDTGSDPTRMLLAWENI